MKKQPPLLDRKKPRIRTLDDLLARYYERVILLALYRSAKRVYFIQCSEGPIKIGWSVEVVNRVKALQTAHPYPLQLIAVIPGDYRIEHWLHRYLKPHLIRGEWYRDCSELRQFLEIVKDATFERRTGTSGT